ncbi:DUF397 domain-containing protein [Streptomyces goshikiensis]|uniref:DUF397 domain-containing protein n=1 Tax=Streptomyces goshikiensis TaxID=1942 RepID=UPI00371A52CF
MSTTPNDGWFKSSYSGDPNGNCVEAKAHPAAVHIRDSKRAEEPQYVALGFSAKAWAAFTSTL